MATGMANIGWEEIMSLKDIYQMVFNICHSNFEVAKLLRRILRIYLVLRGKTVKVRYHLKLWFPSTGNKRIIFWVWHLPCGPVLWSCILHFSFWSCTCFILCWDNQLPTFPQLCAVVWVYGHKYLFTVNRKDLWSFQQEREWLEEAESTGKRGLRWDTRERREFCPWIRL